MKLIGQDTSSGARPSQTKLVMEDDPFLPQALLYARELRGISMAELARRSSISRPWLYRLAQGHRSPTASMLTAMAETLEVPVGFFRREPPTAPGAELLHFRKAASVKKRVVIQVRSVAGPLCQIGGVSS